MIVLAFAANYEVKIFSALATMVFVGSLYNTLSADIQPIHRLGFVVSWSYKDLVTNVGNLLVGKYEFRKDS